MAGTPLLDDGALYTAVGHRGLDLCNPLGCDQVDELIARLEPAPDAGALDLGCGKAELLIRLAERAGCRGVGVDINELLLDRYEWHHHRNLQAHLRAHPGDDQAARLWQRRLRWRDAYLRAGRNVFGFAVIVARRPAT